MFFENALYGGFFVLYSISSLLLFQRRRLVQKQAKQGFGGYGGASDSGDKQRLRTMKFWEVAGAIMFVVVTFVSAFQIPEQNVGLTAGVQQHWMLQWVLYIGDPPDMPAKMIQFARLIMTDTTIFLGDLIMVWLRL
jgi:hypothetical protein